MSPNRGAFRIFIAAVVLPATMVCADEFALEAAGGRHWEWQVTLVVFTGFVIQTALLGWTVGRWLPNWHWRLGVLAWGVVLTNLLLFRAAADTTILWNWSFTNPVQLLCNAFLSAQFAAAIVWLMIGAAPLGERLLTGAVLLSPPAIMLSTFMAHRMGVSRAEFWFAVMSVQSIATMGLIAWLAALRWRVERLDLDALGEAVQRLQFSIRHLLIATTAAAIVTALGKAVATHSGAVTQSAAIMRWREWLQIAIDGSLLGASSLVAVWAALGKGGRLLRFTMLLLLSASLAGLLWWSEITTEALLAPGASSTWWFRQTFAGRWWLGWTLLAGSFLASWLSVLRAAGYRLVRRSGRGQGA
ncbi:MAG TPA: hypothetical protein VG826_31735 [Pirellulales bacterium]|nr:hypothetical protein [Pirellulales bacterium]